MYPSTPFPTSGVFVEEQIKGMRAAGLDVSVLFVNRRQEGAMTYYRLGERLRQAAAEFGPDLLHVMYGGVMADQIVRRHHLVPTVVTFHGSDLLGENLSGLVRKTISRYGVHCSKRAARLAEGVVVVARHLLPSLDGGVSGDKVRVIPCGIDLERFRPLGTSACKRLLGWDPEAFHVLFASSSGDPVKRPWLARAAVAQMNGAAKPAEMHLLTSVPNNQVPVWLNASDVLILTSLHEGSPTIVKEALACGLPVVSVDVGDVAERIKDIDGCHLAPPQPDALAAKLNQVRNRGCRLDCRLQLDELSTISVGRKLKQFYQEITKECADACRVESTSQWRTRTDERTTFAPNGISPVVSIEK